MDKFKRHRFLFYIHVTVKLNATAKVVSSLLSNRPKYMHLGCTLAVSVSYSTAAAAVCRFWYNIIGRGPVFSSVRGLHIEPMLQKFYVFSRKITAIRSFGHGCTLSALPRSTQPSSLPETVNKYQPHGWVLIQNMVMGECLANSSLQSDTKVKFAAWPTSWHWLTSLWWPKWTLAYGFAP